MTYQETTNSGAVVQATWKGNHIEIATFLKDGSVLLEWAYTMDYAAHRFQWLLAKYSASNHRPYKGSDFVKESQLQRLARWADFDASDDQYRDGRNPDDREWMSRVQDTY